MTAAKSELRTKPKLVRWTPTEIATVTDRAKACGLTVARFVREAALGAVPKAARNADHKAVLRELARSGNNLNQLAHEAHAREMMPVQEKLDAALELHMNVLRQLAAATHEK
jgi:mobilization protein NikA